MMLLEEREAVFLLWLHGPLIKFFFLHPFNFFQELLHSSLNIKEQILLSCLHTFLKKKYWGELLKDKKNSSNLFDHILNGPFAASGYMVQNLPCWRASYVLGHPKQRNCKFVLMKSLCSGCLSRQLALQHGGFCTM